MASFLNFLAQDITNHPQTIQPLDISRGFELVEGMDINLDDDITDNE